MKTRYEVIPNIKSRSLAGALNFRIYFPYINYGEQISAGNLHIIITIYSSVDDSSLSPMLHGLPLHGLCLGTLLFVHNIQIRDHSMVMNTDALFPLFRKVTLRL